MSRESFGTCSVHKVHLVQADVPVHYGSVDLSYAYLCAGERLFPNAHSFQLGGVCVDPEYHPKTTTVRYCPKCREAEAAWLAEFPDESSRNRESERLHRAHARRFFTIVGVLLALVLVAVVLLVAR